MSSSIQYWTIQSRIQIGSSFIKIWRTVEWILLRSALFFGFNQPKVPLISRSRLKHSIRFFCSHSFLPVFFFVRQPFAFLLIPFPSAIPNANLLFPINGIASANDSHVTRPLTSCSHFFWNRIPLIFVSFFSSSRLFFPNQQRSS